MLKRATALAAGATLPLAAAIALAPAANAQDSPTVTETVDVTYACVTDNSSNIGGAGTWSNEVEVTYPATVSPGERFDVSIQPGTMQPNQSRTGRVTYDIQMPDNTGPITHGITSPATGFNSGTAQLVTVDPTTKANTTGTDTLRIWGGNSARYGTGAGTNTTNGLRKTSNAAFQLPEVTFSMRAPNAPGEDINFGLPGAGAEAANNAANAQFQYTRGTGTSGTQVECAVSANAAELTSTTITDDPWVPFEWNTPLTIQAQLGELGEDSLAVNVVTSFERPTNDFPEGTMVEIFRDGESVGQVELPETGTSVTFEDEIARGADDRVYRYTAEIVEATDESGDTWVGATATASPVIVTGTGATPSTGSLDFGSLGAGSLGAGSLIDPISGSLTASVSDSVGYDVAPLSSPSVIGMLSSAS